MCKWSAAPPGDPDGPSNGCNISMPIFRGNMTVVETDTANSCNYAVASPQTGCDVPFSKVRSMEMDVGSDNCKVSPGDSVGPWVALYAFEDQHWSAERELDFAETFYGGSWASHESVNTNFDGHATQKSWKSKDGQYLRQSAGWMQHVSAKFVRQDAKSTLVAIKHCDAFPASGSCFSADEQPDCQQDDTACRTFQFTPGANVKFILDVWHAGRDASAHCGIVASPVTIGL